MRISFDVHDTLIRSNPSWKDVRATLVQQYSDFEDINLEWPYINAVFKKIKEQNDPIIARYGTQPDNHHLFAQVCSAFNISDMSGFRVKYVELWQKNTSLIFSDHTLMTLEQLRLEGHELFICSNTLMVPGRYLKETLHQLGIAPLITGFKFSDEVQWSKPYKLMFYDNCSFHVGDNHVTDGACQQYGIEFFQINSNEKTILDFYEAVHQKVCSKSILQ